MLLLPCRHLHRLLRRPLRRPGPDETSPSLSFTVYFIVQRSSRSPYVHAYACALQPTSPAFVCTYVRAWAFAYQICVHSFTIYKSVAAITSFAYRVEMSESKQRFRRISLTLGRKKKKSADDRYLEVQVQRDSVADENGELYWCCRCVARYIPVALFSYSLRYIPAVCTCCMQ